MNNGAGLLGANEINGLLADFDGKTVAAPDFLNGLYLL